MSPTVGKFGPQDMPVPTLVHVRFRVAALAFQVQFLVIDYLSLFCLFASGSRRRQYVKSQ